MNKYKIISILWYPAIGSRWMRPGYDSSKGLYNGYTVIAITNIMHKHKDHPPQVVYKGDNGFFWSLPVSKWPGNLTEEVESEHNDS